MRILFTVEGGLAFFPGINRTVAIEVADLPPQERAELQRLLQAARFFARSEQPSEQLPAKPDAYTYTITVEEDGTVRSLRLVEPVQDPQLQALVRYLRRQR